MKWLLKVNTWFLLINFTLELMTVNTNLDMVTDLTENTAERITKIAKITKITKIKIGSYLVILHSLLHTASSNKVKLHLGRCLVGVEFYKRRD